MAGMGTAGREYTLTFLDSTVMPFDTGLVGRPYFVGGIVGSFMAGVILMQSCTFTLRARKSGADVFDSALVAIMAVGTSVGWVAQTWSGCVEPRMRRS